MIQLTNIPQSSKAINRDDPKCPGKDFKQVSDAIFYYKKSPSNNNNHIKAAQPHLQDEPNIVTIVTPMEHRMLRTIKHNCRLYIISIGQSW
jgi:hypothetical protein